MSNDGSIFLLSSGSSSSTCFVISCIIVAAAIYLYMNPQQIQVISKEFEYVPQRIVKLKQDGGQLFRLNSIITI